MKRCGISFDTLADYRDGHADASAGERIREHLAAGCANCVEGMAWLERAALRIREAEQVSPPQQLVDRLQQIFTDRYRAPVRTSILARLSFDGRSRTVAAGARGAGTTAFKMIYSTDEQELELWEEPVDGGTWYVIGSLLPLTGDAPTQPDEVVLTSGVGEALSVAPESTEFHLAAVAPGTYRLSVRFAESEIVVPDFVVGRGLH